jgi:THO complex subunit 1
MGIYRDTLQAVYKGKLQVLRRIKRADGKDMPASRGKALPLLRTINAFLRFLPRTPEDLVFRGRVHQFASSVISIADKSAINLRGDYNEIKTVWEEPEVVEEKDVNGDVEMDEKKEREDKKEVNGEEDTKPEADFYATLWSLQQYFAHPPSLAPSPQARNTGPTPFASFRQKSEIVLPILFAQTKKQKELMGREVEVGKKRKREDGGDAGGFFHPRFLTGKKLLEHEVCDSLV